MRTPFPGIVVARWNTVVPWTPATTEAAEWTRRRRAARRIADTAREALSDRLFAAAGGLSGSDPERDRLIGIRRRVRAGRALPDGVRLPDWVEEAAAALAAAEEYVRDLDAALAGIVGPALVAERATLLEALAHPALRATAALQSPDLAAALDSHVAGGGAASGSRRRSERRLLDYAYRSMLRTTPFGRLTAVSVIPEGHSAAVDEAGTRAPRTVVHLDFHLQDELRAAAAAGTTSTVRAAASCHRLPDSGVVRFTRVVRGQPQRLTVAETALVRDLLALAELGPVRPATLVEHLAEAGHGDPAALSATVASSVQNGLLVPAPGPGAAPFADSFAGGTPLGDLSVRLAASAGDARDRVLREACSTVSDCAVAVGRPLRPVFYEDALGTAAQAPAVPGDLHARLRPALRAGAVFDRNLDLRLISTALVAARTGDGPLPVVRGARAVVEQAYTVLGLVTERALPERELRRLVSAEYADLVRFRRAVERDVARAAADDPAEIVFPERWIDELMAAAPDVVRSASAVGYAAYVQRSGERLVLNDAYAGSGAMLARFLHPEIEEHAVAIGQLRDAVASWSPRVIQDVDLHGLSVNRVPRLAGEVMTADIWRGLTAQLRPDGLGLEFRTASGESVAPLVFGAGMPERHPHAARLISWNLLGGRLVRTPLHAVHAAHRAEPGPRRSPRLVIGDVVLARQRWTGVEALRDAVRDAGREPAARFRAYTERAHREGLPPAAFVKRDPLVGSREPGAKPLFVDGQSVLSVSTLPERIGDVGNYTHVEECLPLPEPGRAVAEFVAHVDLEEA
ncbi:lantibiotic dehydratase [Tsukamurella sp. NPDC003166]|uniref:lantibiotic dehydratase n=1 Tax=Tsukamurella sp. NPDC003166 TaxID=3154444 RepID=UPI0033B4760B